MKKKNSAKGIATKRYTSQNLVTSLYGRAVTKLTIVQKTDKREPDKSKLIM